MMILVIDANVIFSALIRKSLTLKLLEFNKIFKIFELVAPEYLIEEIKEHEEEIINKSELRKEDLEKVMNFIFSGIRIIPEESFSEFLEEAKKISTPNDFPYVALALKLKSLGLEIKIWSNDKKLKKALEGKIDVVSTSEIYRKFFNYK